MVLTCVRHDTHVHVEWEGDEGTRNTRDSCYSTISKDDVTTRVSIHANTSDKGTDNDLSSYSKSAVSSLNFRMPLRFGI